jgi:hypothetical protein
VAVLEKARPLATRTTRSKEIPPKKKLPATPVTTRVQRLMKDNGGDQKVLAGGGAPSPKVIKPNTGGLLDIVVSPWARVKIDGHEIGQTPFRHYHLSPGVHWVELYNSELNKKDKIKVIMKKDGQESIRRNWGYE